MLRKGILLTLITVLLSGCVTSLMTGAQLVYDRHNVFKQLDDFNLATAVNRTLYKDRAFQGSYIDVTVFNKDVLLAGQTGSQQLKKEAFQRVKKIPNIRRVFNEIKIDPRAHNQDALNDGLITASIRAQMVADDDINPKQFKVVTEKGTVYLLGDVKRQQAQLVVDIARHTQGVKKVVRIFRYYTYQEGKAQA